MLLDIIHASYLHEDYERRLPAERLVRLALKARAENAAATADSRGQGRRWGAKWAITPWPQPTE